MARVLAFCLLLSLALGRATVAAEPLTVFGAASLTDALTAAGEAWRERSGGEVRFSFASSSVLARQIEAGAPADIFASANEAWMDRLAEAGLIDTASRTSPIANSLVLIAPAGSALGEVEIGPSTDFLALLPPDGRVAVGDTAHVPAGIYAKQALTNLGAWAALEPRLALADNVRAALALVERGEAPLGIVYATDAAIVDEVKVVGRFPGDSHEPITYPFAMVKGREGAAARAFMDFLTSDDGLAIFQRYGFRPTAP